MELLTSLVIFLFGLIVGSFVNAWVIRLNTGVSVIGGRSQCMSCTVTLSWYDLVPVASFLVLKGKCRDCGSRISRQYPLVELVMGALFVLTYTVFGFSLIAALVAAASVFLVGLSVYDIYHTIIPDRFVYPFIALGVIAAFVSGSVLSFVLAGVGLAAFLWLLWFVSGGSWMGFGDGKIALGIGLFLGPAAGISALMVAFWAGAVISLILLGIGHLLKKRRFSLKSQIPFAPFLVIGFYFILFSGLVFIPWF